MKYFSIHDYIDDSQRLVKVPFVYKDSFLKNGPLCGLTIKAAGSMRFRWNEENPLREKLLKNIAAENNLSIGAVELIHSKSVLAVNEASELENIQADGIVTRNQEIMPVVTVADCMPLYLYDNKTGAFGIVHSGWKGTGIVGEAVKLCQKEFDSRPENISVIIGPHIHDCCYIVNEERAEYFAENFTEECVKPLENGGSCFCGGKGLPVVWNNGAGQLFRLSLEKANLCVLEKSGILSENIGVCRECTCCTEILGSNRRETAEATAKADLSGNLHKDFNPALSFTVMAAFVLNRK